ncbi:TRAP transporter small permease [Notoacmeibacter marinus]|uniref:TRAP transporter small permease n=1 Tax=Notoacmeibacter marinus TaxID=1876515 RepID=UPI000DF2B163|nr:TRAP transporter small permease subunit [Notoacmeibacter marinus]
MGALLSDAWSIVLALFSGDSWTLSDALRSDAAWLVGLVATLGGGLLLAGIYKLSGWVEENLERFVMVWSYLLIAAIIFVEVFRRFILNQQAPWSTTLPPFLFLIMTWAGCAYNVKLRTHLSFIEFRSAMPRGLQFACLVLDAVLWVGFAWVVVVTSIRIVANSAANFQILLGTDNVLQWWLLISVPISFIMIAARSIENFAMDVRRFTTGGELVEPAVIGGD